MKFSVAVIIAAAASLVSAQLGDIPSCANTCAMTGISGTGCSLTDMKCICENEDFIKNIYSCIETACDKSDQEKTLTAAQKLCSSAGAAIPSSFISSLTAEASASGSATSATASASSSPSATTTGSGATASESSAADKLVPGLGLGAAAAALLLL